MTNPQPIEVSVVVDEVAVPLMLNDLFIPPDLEEVCKYYSKYVEAVLGKGGTPRTFQSYLMSVISQVERRGCNGYSVRNKKCFGEFIAHVGLHQYEEWCRTNARTEQNPEGSSVPNSPQS